MWEIIQSGGPMMVPLIACAILAIAYSIERVWIFSQLPTSEEAQSELDRLETALRNGGEQAVVEECNQGKGLLNYVFASLLKRYDTLIIEQREFKETNEEIIRLADAGGGGQVSRFMVMQRELADLKDELVIQTEAAARGLSGQTSGDLEYHRQHKPFVGLARHHYGDDHRL